MPKGALRFKNMTVGKQQGELARFRVLGGPDSGAVYVITSAKATIGRAEDNDVILTDIKASRKHAELSLVGGQAQIRDIGSSHGFMVNGIQQKQMTLRNGDKIGMGATVLEFISAGEQGATQMIVRAPVQTSKVIGTINSQSGLTQFIQRPQQQAGAAPGAKPAQQQSFLEKNKKLVGMIVILMALSGGAQQYDQKIRKKQTSYVSPLQDAAAEAPVLSREETANPAFKQAEIYFKLGKRELNAKNYLRAQANFETALSIYNGHKLADVYLKTVKKEMESEAKGHIEEAKRDEAANRVQNAINHYNAIKRLFNNDQSNKYFKDADQKLQDLDKRLKEMEGS